MWRVRFFMAAMLVVLAVAIGVDPASSSPTSVPATTASVMPAPDDAVPGTSLWIADKACPGAGRCVAVGNYLDNTYRTRGLIESFDHGTWTALRAPADASGDTPSTLDHVSCADPGWCYAIGDGIAEIMQGDAWTPEKAVIPGPWGIPFWPWKITCPVAGWCAAYGEFVDAQGNQYGPGFGRLADGSWHADFVSYPSGGTGGLNDIDCAAPDSCAAVGSYRASGRTLGLIETDTDGVWTATTAPVSDASVGMDVALQDVDCPSIGVCAAVGSMTALHQQRAVIERLTDGQWRGGEAPLPNGVSTSSTNGLTTVSCPDADWCAALGPISSTDDGDSAMLLETLSADGWAPRALSAPKDLEAQHYDLRPSALSCPASGVCHVLATTNAATNNAFDFIGDLQGDVWSAHLAPLPFDDWDDDFDQGLDCPSTDWCQLAFGYYGVGGAWTNATLDLPLTTPETIAAVTTSERGRPAATILDDETPTANLQNLGGESAWAPTAVEFQSPVTQAPETMFFVTGTTKAVYYRTWAHGWYRLQGDGLCVGPPGVTARVTHVVLTCRGTDSKLYFASLVQVASGGFMPAHWQAMGGPIAGPPAVAYVGGQLTFFVVQSDHVLYRRTADMSFASMTAQCSSWPVVSTAPDRARVDLVCTGMDRHLHAWTDNGNGWSMPRNLGGTVVGAPAVSAGNSGALFFVEGTDGALWMRNSAHWVRLGGSATAGASAAALN